MKKSRIILWTIISLLAITGIVLFLLSPSDPDGFPHPLNNLFRQLHGWLAGCFLVMSGFMVSDHMQKKWRRHLRRIEGSLHLSVWILLVVSGWLIYYPPLNIGWINSEWITWSHWIIGIIVCIAFPLHALRKLKHEK